MWKFLLCEGEWKDHWQPHDLITRLLEQIKVYRRKNTTRLVNDELKEAQTVLKAITRRFQNKAQSTRTPALRALLQRTADKVKASGRALSRLRKAGQTSRFSPLGAWEQLWPEFRKRPWEARRIELDTELQLQLGKTFAVYLRNEGVSVSMETISRLIVLGFWTGGLADIFPEEGKAELKTICTGRFLSVRNVRENLRSKGLHRADAFNSKGGKVER